MEEGKQMFYFVHVEFKMPVRQPSMLVKAPRPELPIYKSGKGQMVGGSSTVNLKRSAHRQKLGGDAGVHHGFVHGAQRLQLRGGDEDHVGHELRRPQHLQGLCRTRATHHIHRIGICIISLFFSLSNQSLPASS